MEAGSPCWGRGPCHSLGFVPNLHRARLFPGPLGPSREPSSRLLGALPALSKEGPTGARGWEGAGPRVHGAGTGSQVCNCVPRNDLPSPRILTGPWVPGHPSPGGPERGPGLANMSPQTPLPLQVGHHPEGVSPSQHPQRTVSQEAEPSPSGVPSSPVLSLSKTLALASLPLGLLPPFAPEHPRRAGPRLGLVTECEQGGQMLPFRSLHPSEEGKR